MLWLRNDSVDAQKTEVDYPFGEEIHIADRTLGTFVEFNFDDLEERGVDLLSRDASLPFICLVGLWGLCKPLCHQSRCLLEVMEAREEHPRVKYFKPPLTQDERLQKREKRKQCNRESARRSRLRKQIERDHLQASVDTLTNENNLLREELKRISDECEKLASENVSLKGESSKHLGPENVPEDDDYL